MTTHAHHSTNLEESTKKHQIPKAVAEALKGPPLGKICSTKPRRCQRNAAFIINTSFLDDPDDCLSDDLGPFRHNGQKRWYFVGEGDEGFIEIEEPTTMEEGVYVLEKKYWVHLRSDDFRRQLWRLCDWTGQPVKYVMVEYSFKARNMALTLCLMETPRKHRSPSFALRRVLRKW